MRGRLGEAIEVDGRSDHQLLERLLAITVRVRYCCKLSSSIPKAISTHTIRRVSEYLTSKLQEAS